MAARLHDVVIIGFCDISAAGCRAVLGCNRKVRALTLPTSKIDIDGIGSQINDVDGEIPLFSTVDCDDKKVTLISISSTLSSGAASHFINEILNEVRNSQTREIMITASIPIKMSSVTDSEVFQIAINCDKVKNIKCLPDNFLIKDAMLNMMIQLCQVENIPLRCIVTRGYRTGSGVPNHQDGSLQSVTNLQKTLNSLYGLTFDAQQTQSLAYTEKVANLRPQNTMFL